MFLKRFSNAGGEDSSVRVLRSEDEPLGKCADLIRGNWGLGSAVDHGAEGRRVEDRTTADGRPEELKTAVRHTASGLHRVQQFF